MTDLAGKDYVVILQCHIVKERCPGYLCEKAFHERTGGFAEYPRDKTIRCLTITCGGCCGRASHRKLTQFLRTIAKKEGVTKDRIVVQLSSCVAKDNYHSPPCPHLGQVRAATPGRSIPSIAPRAGYPTGSSGVGWSDGTRRQTARFEKR